jgi:hypothetical protein
MNKSLQHWSIQAATQARQTPQGAPRIPRSTIKTEAGNVVIEATAGRVFVNGRSMLPHEAVLMGSEIERFAVIAQRKAEEAAASARQAA